MLIEEPRIEKRRAVPRWIWIAASAVVCLAAAGIVILATHWPFSRDAMTRALEQASGRQVQIRTFSNVYFPPGCTAEGIRFLRHKHPEAEPIITVEKLVVRGSFLGMVTSPKRLAAVRVVGMHMLIASKTTGGESTSVSLNSGQDGKSLEISSVVADGAVLEFVPDDRKSKPYMLKVDRLALTDVGSGTRMKYRTTLTNTLPPGVIRAEGKFGPWNPSDIGSTPVSGTYTYEGIDLGAFDSIAGTAKARGQFSGPLSRIETHGRVDVTGFHVDGSDHTLPLATTYEATVNGTNGDVQLNPGVARFRQTQIEVRGWIAGHEGGQGKTASFDLNVSPARVDDLLYLFTRGEPGLNGSVTAKGQFLWPPEPRKFLEKIRLDLMFGMTASHFTNPDTQNSIDRLSESAQGEKKKQQDVDPRTVLSLMHGNIQVRNGSATISGGNFSVPGADATLQGSYNLLNQKVDLKGTLDTKGNLSDTATGFKALVLKAVTPLFRKQHSIRIIPFQITGSYGNTSVGIDWKRDLLHSPK